MNKPPFTRFRLQTFPDLTTANASTEKFGYGDFIAIAGDITRFKMGNGMTISAKSPAAPTGKTFAQLPWVYTDGATSKTPGVSFAQNATGTITAANLLKKNITTTSVAAVGMTLDTATNIGAAVGAVVGTEVDFTVDNSAGANTLTVIVGTGIVAATPALTGGATLTVIAGTFAKFKIIFKDATHALIFRTL